MTGTPRRYPTGIESSDAVLPAPPGLWSYSSLRDVEACPRRYALSRATYPDLWSGRGYPRRPSAAALFGDVVHGALERIVRGLVADGCALPRSAEAVEVLRRLGGYTAVVEAVAEARLKELDDGNPRLETYALLWDLDRDANPGRRPVTGLTAAYPGRDVTFPAPDGPAMRAIEENLATRIAEADAELEAPVPRAVPAAENCGTCEVRQLCDEYWENIAPDPSSVADQERFDCQGTVEAANGPRGWWFRRKPDLGSSMLIQASRTGPSLTPGDRVRILGLRVAPDPESETTVAVMNSAAEVFKRNDQFPEGG